MVVKHPQRYFWTKYFLAVILLIVVVIFSFTLNITVGTFLLFCLCARIIVGPIQMYLLTKKGKFDDLRYLTVRNKQNAIIGIGVIIAVALLFVILSYNLFTVGFFSLPILSILTVFIVVDFGYDILTYFQLKKRDT